MQPLVVVRPPQIRVASLLTLVVIVSWAALNGDVGGFGVIVYPLIIGLQTAREWGWRLTVTPKGLEERQVIGGTRTFTWKAVRTAVMPDAAWWRVNPVLKVEGAPSIQLTAAEDVDAVIRLARQKRTELVGDPASVSLGRSLMPWITVLGLACVLLAAEIASRTA